MKIAYVSQWNTHRRPFIYRAPVLVALVLAVVAVVLIVGRIIAFNAILSGFEIDGDLRSGEFPGQTVPDTVTGVDWAQGPSGGTGALLDDGTDNPAEPGDASFLRDPLKVETDDTTFTQGDKENDRGLPTDNDPVDWHITEGGIPPNKDDLFNVYTYALIDGAQADVVLGVERTNNLGSSHLDFEFNRLPWELCPEQTGRFAGSVCPARSEGDILVAYEITNGGAVSSVQFFVWDLPGGIDAGAGLRTTSTNECDGFLATGGNQLQPCPWEEVAFDPAAVVATLNQNPIPAGPWGSKEPDGTPQTTIPEFGFFEVLLDFDALGFGPGCPGFAQASVKTRSSGTSVASALQDLAGPLPIDLDNCGSITVEKQTDPAGSLQTFDFDLNPDPEGEGTQSLADDESFTWDTLPPDTYVLSEDMPVPAGWDLTSIDCDTTVAIDLAAGTAEIDLDPLEDVTCLFTNVQRGTIIVEKQTIPDAASGDFEFTGHAAGTIQDDGQIVVNDLVPGTYTSSETDPTPAFDLTSIFCDDANSSGDVGTLTATFQLEAGETVKCTFTNTQRGMARVLKTTNGVVDPTITWTFTLNGPEVSVTDTTDASGVVDFEGAKLIPGETYTICEINIPAGWTVDWSLDGVPIIPYNPDAGSGQDLGTRCYDFSVDPGQMATFQIDNVPPPGGEQRTIGYWKNWNRCSGGRQQFTADKNGGAAAGFFLVEDLLPQQVSDLDVTECEQAVKVLSKQAQNGNGKKNHSNDGAYALAAQLLAAKLNVAAGAGTCTASTTAIDDAQALLDSINFNGSGHYLGPKSKDSNRPIALSLASQLDQYNNGLLCPG